MVAVRAPAAQFCTSAWLTKALSALPSNSKLQSSASCRRGSGRLDWAKSWRYLEEKQDTPVVEVYYERYSRGCVALSNLLNLYRLTCAVRHPKVGLLKAISLCFRTETSTSGNGWKHDETTQSQWPQYMWCRCIGSIAHVATTEDRTLLWSSGCLHPEETAQRHVALSGHIGEPWHTWTPEKKEMSYPVLPIVWVKNTSEEARNCLSLLGKHLLSTSLGTCLESDWLCGRVMACWPYLMCCCSCNCHSMLFRDLLKLQIETCITLHPFTFLGH